MLPQYHINRLKDEKFYNVKISLILKDLKELRGLNNLKYTYY